MRRRRESNCAPADCIVNLDRAPTLATAERRQVIERSLFRFIWKYSRRDQVILLAVTMTLFPLLYLF